MKGSGAAQSPQQQQPSDGDIYEGAGAAAAATLENRLSADRQAASKEAQEQSKLSYAKDAETFPESVREWGGLCAHE